jgi:antitoxin component of RelBE/YafQ-DinJ toxin-antitoxin module
VDGGCWATVEGRAILAYQKLGQYADSFKAADTYMRWAKEYRQDEPFSQWGHNTNNPWQQESDDHTACKHPVAVMVDNFAPITCLLRGLFDYAADAEGLSVTPRIPAEITALTQHEPVYFNDCSLYITYEGGSGDLFASLNGEPLSVDDEGRVRIPADALPRGGEVCLALRRGEAPATVTAEEVRRDAPITGDIAGVPEELAVIYRECAEALETVEEAEHAAMLREILLFVEAAAQRRRLPFDVHELRPMTEDKVAKILELYDKTAMELYQGLGHRR